MTLSHSGRAPVCQGYSGNQVLYSECPVFSGTKETSVSHIPQNGLALKGADETPLTSRIFTPKSLSQVTWHLDICVNT